MAECSSDLSVFLSKSNTSRPRKSLVWDYFEYDEELNKSRQVLKSPTSSDSDLLGDLLGGVCGHEITGKFPKQHLKKAHPGPYEEIIKKEAQEIEAKAKQEVVKQKASLKVSQQLTLAQSVQSRVKYDRTNDRFKSITQKLAIFINVPNSSVEDLEFCDFLHTADSRYAPTSRTVISKEIEKIFY